ncbi:fatty acid desaturase CarF family protein [Ideonella livida]|uniref:Lipid desaturase domain-containing protein n=1 Tax=Ideonella livida TaxID=2707176 RepID=A0A7C9PKT5_9BURK|nr:fatty acid desaturase CarF family protein [Ideonella livida]NDY93752.1 hypothetical protein [Ideonella livida]
MLYSIPRLRAWWPRATVLTYHLLVLWSLWQLPWGQMPALGVVGVVLAALWLADLLTGLVHLCLDYACLNFERGFGQLFHHQGPRRGPAFQRLRDQVMRGANWVDRKVYTFKIHHRHGQSNQDCGYAGALVEFLPASAAILAGGLGLHTLLQGHAAAGPVLLLHVALSFFVGHAQWVHYCMHGSRAMPRSTRVVRALSRWGLIYSPQTHAEHHRDGLIGFCFITGHANFVVNWLCARLLARGVIHLDDWHGVPR